MRELGQQERRLELRQAVVGGQGIVQVARLAGPTTDAVQQPGPLRQRIVVGQDDAPFAAGERLLSWNEKEPNVPMAPTRVPRQALPA